jgi:hypothetical protein
MRKKTKMANICRGLRKKKIYPVLKSLTHIGFIGVEKNGSKISHLGTFKSAELRICDVWNLFADRSPYKKHTPTVFIPHTVCKMVDYPDFRLFSISNIGIDFGIPSFGCHFSQEIRFPANFPYFSHVVFHAVR